MKLFTAKQMAQLVGNHRNRYNDPHDPQPVVKLYNPYGAGTWLLSEYDPETQIAFGLCDLGAGYPELGDVSMIELSEYRARNHPALKIERDRHWSAVKTLSQYARDARAKGRIE